MTASGRKLNVEAPLTAKACVVGVSPTGTQIRIAGSCGLCCCKGIARPRLATSPQAYRTEGDRPTVRLTVRLTARPALPQLGLRGIYMRNDRPFWPIAVGLWGNRVIGCLAAPRSRPARRQ